MKNFYTKLGLIVLVFLTACKSATKLYEKGNYDEAVQVAVKKLQKDPTDAKLRSVVQDAYRYAVTDHENRISNYSKSSSELKYEWMYNEYADLQRLYDAIFKAPSVFELIRPTDYTSTLMSYSEKAGDVHIKHGMDFINNNDKQSFKLAYREFQIAANFKPGNTEVQQLLNESYDAALTRVMVMPADDRGGYRFSSYGNDFTDFDKNILRSLQYNSGSEFVKFYSSWDVQRLNIVPDEIIETHFAQLNIGRQQENYSTREVTKDVVVKETVYSKDSVIKQYAKVKATLTTTKRTLYSEGTLNISVRDNTGRWLWNDNITGTHNWATEFTTYTGDERALTDDDKKLINTARQIAPKEDEITRCIKESINNDLSSRIRNYYSRY